MWGRDKDRLTEERREGGQEFKGKEKRGKESDKNKKLILLELQMPFRNSIRFPGAPTVPPEPCIVDTSCFEVSGVPQIVLASPPFGDNLLTKLFTLT